ncbi:replication protein A 70 kDa DNA-binding subunit B, partial [Tanacetum coccineum]
MEYQKDSNPRQRRSNLKKTAGADPDLGDRIQVYIEKEWMFIFEPLLQEGICYKISNFGVTENGGRIPLLPHGWKLSFYNTTIVTRIEQIDENVTGFINELFTLLLDTNEEYQENDAV